MAQLEHKLIVVVTQHKFPNQHTCATSSKSKLKKMIVFKYNYFGKFETVHSSKIIEDI